jgi:histidine triad (HIT) family protein
MNREAECIFCRIVRGTAPATVVYEDEPAISFLPLPEDRIADGHLLVLPKRHVADLFDARADDLAAVMSAAKRVSEALRETVGASGVNVLSASGPHTGQSVLHLHFHIVPRWQGDDLTMWPSSRSSHELPTDYATLLQERLRQTFCGPAA